MGLESGGKFRNLKLGADSLVGLKLKMVLLYRCFKTHLHVEALDAIGTVDLGDELRVEGNDNGGSNEDSLRVQRARASDVA